MYPHEQLLVKKYENQPFALIGVNSDSDLEAIRKIVKEKSLTWRSFWNGEKGTSGPISAAWKVQGWPTVWIIDAEGKLRVKNPQRAGSYEVIDKAIDELLAEAKAG